MRSPRRAEFILDRRGSEPLGCLGINRRALLQIVRVACEYVGAPGGLAGCREEFHVFAVVNDDTANIESPVRQIET